MSFAHSLYLTPLIHVVVLVSAAGDELSGQVVNREGRYLPDAQVHLLSPGQEAHFRRGELAYVIDTASGDKVDAPTVTSDSSGRFSMAVHEGPFVLVITHEYGYAQTSNTAYALGPIPTLTPWVRIDGTLMHSQIGVPDTLVTVRSAKFFDAQALDSDVYLSEGITLIEETETRTDLQGHFVVQNVTQREAFVNRVFELDGRRVRLRGLETSLVAEPYLAHDLEIGGRTTPVQGRFVIPLGDGQIEDVTGYTVRISLAHGAQGETGSKQAAAIRRDFLDSSQGRYYQTQTVDLDADGFFKIDDVPAGTYQLDFFAGKDADEPILTHIFTKPVAQRPPYDQPHYVGVFITTEAE